MSIFSDMVEDTVEVFMDDFSVVGDSFDRCLSHLAEFFKRCEDSNLVLNWEKYHFMVKEEFGELKEKLVSAPIIISPDWSKRLDVMCDASGVARGMGKKPKFYRKWSGAQIYGPATTVVQSLMVSVDPRKYVQSENGEGN
ncbi:uncharacterized protein LOC107003699 [Solanum pennellii]|uniref:Uncharacterized protein LOC107003699 n=1 Tax=Solanum pennellii TaxID=28526 RepID=A0ABM1FIW8_SOLPN|nr:uncharacterized protein LOC107003699 [Solanum pennellii]